MRADAERNRVKVLEAAMAAFESDGLSVSVAEIGRRAGVGTGTVSRHFPTKESLYEAIVLARVTEIVGHARDLLETRDPAAAFFEFFAYMVGQAAANRGLAEALSGDGYDIEAAAGRTEHGLEDVEDELLARAQRAGAVRADVTNADVKALVVACLVRERRPPDEVARHRMIDIAFAGLRPTTARRPRETGAGDGDGRRPPHDR